MLCNVSKELAIPQTLRARLQDNLDESWFWGFRMGHMAKSTLCNANKELAIRAGPDPAGSSESQPG